MNELKPEDVVRALECCVIRECMPCPNKERRTGITECMECLMQDALALLREKDAEIERWKAECASFEEINEMWVEENNRLKEAIKIARADTVQKMQERLKEEIYDMPSLESADEATMLRLINQVAKEMVEES